MSNTKEKILASATELFAQKGFSGTSIEDIAQHAGIHKSLIYHHVGNKQALWQAVKRDLIGNIIPEVDVQQFDTLEGFLKYIIHTRIEVYGADPRIGRLLKWQMLEDNPPELTSDHSVSPAYWLGILQRLQSNGQITKKYPAHLIMFFIHSTVAATVLDSLPTLEKNADDKEKYISMLLEILTNSFSA